MSKLATHGMNHKKGAIGGLARHNERMGDNHDNPDIDPERTKDNFYLKKPQVSLYQDCKKEVERVKANGGRLRSDQNWITEFTVYAPKEPLSSKEEYERYFNTVYSFFAEKIGAENIKCAIVHMDEKTPHMHLDFMPIVRNDAGEPVKLSSKEVMTRKFLYSIQDELPKRLQAHGFDVQRGDKVKLEDKHLKGRSTKKYKADMEREKVEIEKQIDGMVQEKSQLKEDIEYLQEKKEKALDDLVVNIEKKQRNIKKDVSYMIQETGMFSNRKKRAVWIELEVLDKLLNLDRSWDELVQNVKLIREQNKVLKEENSTLRSDLHTVLEEKNQLKEILQYELPERDLSVLISEYKERKTEELKKAFSQEDARMRSKMNLKSVDVLKKEPIVKDSIVKTPVVKEGLLPKNKKPTAPSGGGGDR